MPVLWIAAALIVVVTTVEGVRQGVVRRAVELVGLIAVFLFASRLADLLTPILEDKVSIDATVAFYASWAVVLVGGVIAVRAVASGLRKLVHLTLVGWLDRLGGGLLGMAFGLVLASCLFVGAHAASHDLRSELEESAPAELLLNFAPSVYDLGREFFGGRRFFDMVREHAEAPALRLRFYTAAGTLPGFRG